MGEIVRKSQKVTYEDIVKNKEINTYIDMGNKLLGELGYTDHSRAHSKVVADTAADILEKLDFSKKDVELARIAGYMHDIGNSVNRHDHAHSGAIMAFDILRDMHMKIADTATIVSAIGNHDEATGNAVTAVGAALIIADKADVRRSRVRNKEKSSFDKHDRVNYAVSSSKIMVDRVKKTIHLDIVLDEEKCSVLDYFEIFLERMLMCQRAASFLKMKFKFTVNGNKVL